MKKLVFFKCLLATLLAMAALSAGCTHASAGKAQSGQQASGDPAGQGKHKRLLHVGVDEQFPPIVFRDTRGLAVGHDIDLATEAFKRMDMEVEFVPIDWKKKEEALYQTKRVDLIWSGVNITDERKAVFAFSEPYLDNTQVVVVPVASPLRSVADLGNKHVGVQTGTSLLPKLKAYTSPAGSIGKINEYGEYADILTHMIEGKLDAGIMGSVVADYYIKHSEGKFRTLEGNFGQTGMGVAMRKDDVELLASINKTLAQMKADGSMKAIDDRWLK